MEELISQATGKKIGCVQHDCDDCKSRGWQPIETAPKDGTHVLLHNCRDLPATCHWFDDGWHLSMNRYGPFSEWTWTPPTHWMPLPEAPN